MATKERANSTAVIEPQAGPQSLALDTRRFVYELLFGGARGGGKDKTVCYPLFMTRYALAAGDLDDRYRLSRIQSRVNALHI